MSSSIISTHNLSICYADGTTALSDVSVEIERGKTTAILGGNGAGKSSLLLTFNGILKPSTGTVRFNNESISYQAKDLLALRKQVGMVFQSPDTQLFSASVFEDISFGLMNLGLPENEIRRRAEDIMQKTGISALQNKPTHWLSFGQKKRIAIAGVLVMQPDVMLLDEPTSGLDPQGEIEIIALLTNLARELGLTLIMATHDLDLVAMQCHNAIVLSEGRVLFQGTVKDMFHQTEMLQNAGLRLTRIGELMKTLETHDGFEFQELALTISEARKELKHALIKIQENLSHDE